MLCGCPHWGAFGEDTMKKIKFVLFLFLITLFSCSEDIYDYYEKCSESDFEQNCWLPKFLKNIDCKNITLYHNLDTNEIWGKFYIYGDSFLYWNI